MDSVPSIRDFALRDELAELGDGKIGDKLAATLVAEIRENDSRWWYNLVADILDNGALLVGKTAQEFDDAMAEADALGDGMEDQHAARLKKEVNFFRGRR